MYVTILIVALVALGPVVLYFAYRSRDFRKFLAGAFFVSSGIQFYFYQVDITIPFYSTGLVQTPEVSAIRATIHFALFLICFYFGFIRK